MEGRALADAFGARMDESSPPRASSTFLADLPPDALHGVVRRLSGCPTSSVGKPFVDHRDLLSVLRVPEVGKLIPAFFTSLHACDTSRTCVRAHEIYSSDVVVSLGSSRASVQNLQTFLFALSPTLRRLTLDFRHFKMRAFNFGCANLRSLTLQGYGGVSPDLDILLCGSSDKLRELCVEAKHLPQTVVYAISRHCAGLTKLKLKVETSAAPLEPIWATVGPTLQEVGVGKLSTSGLHLRGEALRIVEDDVALALAVGDRLEMFRTTGVLRVSQHSLRKIFDECASCVFDLHGRGYASCVLKAMEFLGTRTHALHVDRRAISNVSLLRDLTAACSAMKTLSLSSVPSGPLNAIFSHPLPRLRRLDVHRHDFKSVANIVSGAFAHACVVEELTLFVPAAWDVAPDAAARFARVANCLRRVSVEELISGSQARMDKEIDPWMIKRVRRVAAQYVRAFAEAAALKELWIASVYLTERTLPIAHACEGLRGRGADVVVGGVHYDPDACS